MEILLTSEKFVKEVLNISDNVAGKYLLPSIREAQEIHLRSVLGDALLDKCKDVVKLKSQEEKYIELINACQYYLAYQSAVELLPRVTYKIGNFGVTKNTDENMQAVSPDDLARQEYFYQSKADAYRLQLQEWILQRDFDELVDCARIKANLESAYTCGIVTGGPRGKILPKKGCCK